VNSNLQNVGFALCLFYTGKVSEERDIMKKFFKIAGYVFLSIIIGLYLAFLFVIPNTINLNKYKSQIQKLVKDNTNLIVDFDKVDVITSPFLEAGIKTNNLKVKLPDNSVLFSADSFKGKVFLPSLIWLSVRVSCAEFDKPSLNIEILNSEKFKVAKVYEDLVNKQRAERRLNPSVQKEEEIPFDLSSIKLFIPALKLNDYSAVIDDVKAGHKLTLKGDRIKLGYFNGKSAKIKTDAQFLSDDNKNITANIDIDTFIPEIKPQPVEEDDEAVFELPFVNPVSVYRDYNLKSNINTKLKVRQSKKDKKIFAKGFVNIEDTTVTLSGMELPKSYFKLLAKGHNLEVDTNLYVTKTEYLNLLGKFDYGKHPYIDLSLKSPKVYFNNVLNILRAYLDTIHLKNGLANMSAGGYMLSNFKIKTDFKTIESNGRFVIRDGNIYDNTIGLILNNINANLLFDDNLVKVSDTSILVNNRPLKISGEIDNSSLVNFNVSADKVPLSGLYLAFAPKEIKSVYDLKSGFLTLNAKAKGEIKEVLTLLKIDLEDFVLSDKAGTFIISNKFLKFGLANINGDIKGRLKNNGFGLSILPVKSTITDDILVATLDNEKIQVVDSKVKLNNKSIIVFKGLVDNYLTAPKSDFRANGFLADSDLKILLGSQVAPYLASAGNIPVKAEFKSGGKKMKVIAQMQSDVNSFITPVKIDSFVGKQILAQVLAEKNGDVLQIKKTGLYIRKPNAIFTDNLSRNLLNSKEAVSVRAMISNLSTNPFINLFKLKIPKDLDGSICIFDKSKFTFGGGIYAFGKVVSPHINGNLYIRNLRIPEIYASVRDINSDITGRGLKLSISDVNLNDSDFYILINSTWKHLAKMKVENVKILSNSVNVDKLMKVSEALSDSLPKVESAANSNAPADIPVEILDGSILLKHIQTGDIIVKNTSGRISLFKNVFYLNNLKTFPMGGHVSGKASINLITTELKAKVQGKDFDMEKVLLDAMQMKDMLSGDLRFIADIALKGSTMEEQMKTLKGYVDFTVKDGQLGPFGKFENFLMAENIRENAFFSSTIGAVIKNIVTIDTSHFNTLYGHLTFDDGFVSISPIKSQGNVMSIYISGKAGLLDNSADMKLRGKLASAFSDSLGPLANINPVNLIKNTPGLNVVAAKTFSIFCESISPEEMAALPELAEGKSDDYATKFQIVLRGDTRKPLKMIKSFKWLALASDIENAQNFVDTIPIPAEGEENLSVEELIQLREQQLQAAPVVEVKTEENKSLFEKVKDFFKRNK